MFNRYNNFGGRGFLAFDPSQPGGVMMLAMQVLQLHEMGQKQEAVALASAVKEAMTAMAVAMALVSHAQNREDPIIALSPEEVENPIGHTPAELLESLMAGFSQFEEEWNEAVEQFCKQAQEMRAELAISKLPKEMFVSDILGEKEEN